MKLKTQLLKLAAGIFGLSVGFWLIYVTVRPKPWYWRKLAELNPTPYQTFVVAQQHYDWVEGWAVNFFYISSNATICGYNLQIETSPWNNVVLLGSNGLIQVKRSSVLLGSFSPQDKTFTNFLSKTSTTNIQGTPLVRVTRPWKWEFRYDGNSHCRFE